MIMHLQFSLVMKISSVVKINLPFTIISTTCCAMPGIFSSNCEFFRCHFVFISYFLINCCYFYHLCLHFCCFLNLCLPQHTHSLSLSLHIHTPSPSTHTHTHTHHSFKNTITSFINKNFTSEQLVLFSMFIISTSGRQSHFNWKGNLKATQTVMHTYAYMFNRWLYSICIFK